MIGLALWRSEGESVGPLNALVFGAILIALGPLVYAWSSRRRRERRLDSKGATEH
jgi:hypothetical protein